MGTDVAVIVTGRGSKPLAAVRLSQDNDHMKACPGCGYLWADEYSGQCIECGKPLGSVQSNGDLRFRYAAQVQAGLREDQAERGMKSSSGLARPGDAYDRVEVPDAVLGAAKRMLVQRADVEYEEE